MGWFGNLKIGKKLGLGFGIVEVLMIALGVFSILQLAKVNGAADTQKAAQQLVETSTQLRRLVEQFKINTAGNGRGNEGAVNRSQSRAAHAGL